MIVFFFRSNRLFYGFYLVSLIAICGVTFFTKDTTRVFALLSWGPTLYCLLHAWRTAPEAEMKRAIFRGAMILVGLSGWCFPRLYLWDGRLFAPWF